MIEKIRLSSLTKSFGEKHVLRGVDLAVHEGETLCIIGRSGTGKSVVIKHLIGLLEPDSGSIEVGGQMLTGVDAAGKRNICAKIGVLFQGAALFDSMNVYDNIAFGLRRTRIGEAAVSEAVGGMVDALGLAGCEHRFPHELSGYRHISDAATRALFERDWGVALDPEPTDTDPAPEACAYWPTAIAPVPDAFA